MCKLINDLCYFDEEEKKGFSTRKISKCHKWVEVELIIKWWIVYSKCELRFGVMIFDLLKTSRWGVGGCSLH
jgi:hypothetical protein